MAAEGGGEPRGLYDDGAVTGKRRLVGGDVKAQSREEAGARVGAGPTPPPAWATEVKTIYEALRYGLKQGDAGRPCMGYRKDGDWAWLTWEEVVNRCVSIAHGLPGARGGECDAFPHVGIFSDPCPEATLIDQAIPVHSRVSVHLHPDWTPETLIYAINKVALKVICCDTSERIGKILALRAQCPSIKELVVMEAEIREEQGTLATAAGINISTLEQIEEVGENPPHWNVPPKPVDPFTIAFTREPVHPKAVILTNQGIIAQATAMHGILSIANLGPDDVFYSGQCLSHISQRVMETCAFVHGAKLLYGARGEKVEEVCASGKPTVVHLRPVTVAELRREGLAIAGVAASLVAKEADLAQSVVSNAGPSDAALAPVRAQLGGRVKLVLTCNEPLSWSMLKYLRLGLGCPVSECYMAAEAGGVVCATDPADLQSWGAVGPPVAGVKVKLRDVAELGLRASIGAGEVCISGPSLSPGYHKDVPLQNAAYIQGWCALGDVAMWRPNGTLKLLGRKTEMWKAGSDLLDPSRVEAVLRRSELVRQVAVVSGAGGALGALVVPASEAVTKAALVEDVKREAAMEGLPPTQVPTGVALVPNLAPANPPSAPWPRLARMPIMAAYAPVVKTLFAA